MLQEAEREGTEIALRGTEHTVIHTLVVHNTKGTYTES